MLIKNLLIFTLCTFNIFYFAHKINNNSSYMDYFKDPIVWIVNGVSSILISQEKNKNV